MYRIAIVEDDPFSQETLKDILLHFSSKYEIVGVFGSVKETLENLPDIDLLLLDMELKDGQGFDVLKELKDIDFEVIITTMHDSFMLEAIKHSALDYLMKPILKSDITQALTRFEKKREKTDVINQASSDSKKHRLVIPHLNGLVLLEIKDIVRLESEGSYTKLFVSDGSSHLTSKNLGYYESHLATHDFIRVHHKHLISLNHVKNYIRGDGGTLEMSDNSKVEVSRRKKDNFLQRLGMQ